MKKYIGFMIIMIMVLSLIGCANNTDTDENQGGTDITENGGADNNEDGTTDPTDPDMTLNDGEYTARGDEWEHGQEDATVVISEGQITEITLRRLDKSGNEVDYDEWTGEERDGKVYPDLKQARIDMANEMIEEQTYDVDTISGATVSTANWKIAVQRALEQAAQ